MKTLDKLIQFSPGNWSSLAVCTLGLTITTTKRDGFFLHPLSPCVSVTVGKRIACGHASFKAINVYLEFQIRILICRFLVSGSMTETPSQQVTFDNVINSHLVTSFAVTK